MTYIPNPQQIEGGQPKIVVTDDNSQQLLTDIIRELKKMNLHMSIMTDNNITNQEIG